MKINTHAHKSAIILLVAALSLVLPAPANAIGDATNVERAVTFAIQQEIQAAHLEKKSDVCVGFAPEATLSGVAVLSQLRRMGSRLHSHEWCNSKLRGIVIGIIGNVRQLPGHTYEFEVEVGDQSGLRNGEHFGTLLRRGTYVIESKDGALPRLIEYRNTCCAGSKDHMSQ